MPEVRRELYKRITDSAKEGLKAYYDRFPDRFEDERSKEAIIVSMEGLRKIKAILSEYDIIRKAK